MKRLLLTAVSLSWGIGVFAQVQVDMNNDVPGVIVTHVYAPLPSNPHLSRIGNGGIAPLDFPLGATSWSGFTPLGAGGATQLLGAPGYNDPESALLPGSPALTFHTGSLAGFVQGAPLTGTVVTFNSMLSTTTQATLEMVAWDNSSGLYPTWAQASVAWQFGLIAAGRSGVWNQDGLGGLTAPHMINSTDPTQHAQSFNIYFVPEPGTAALAGLGTAAMLILRRRKQ